jgi:hypothetical protein
VRRYGSLVVTGQVSRQKPLAQRVGSLAGSLLRDHDYGTTNFVMSFIVSYGIRTTAP